MIAPGERVLAAVSGGLDSMSMLYALNTLSVELKFELAVGHVDHQTRGGVSTEDARHVVGLARELGLPALSAVGDVQAERRRLKMSFQEAARVVRYRLLENMAAQWGATRIAFAHTADDQVETVLMNFLRGSGALGMAGIPPVRANIIRPLCDCLREELERAFSRVPWRVCEDVSNRKTEYLRNRVRLELIPALEKNYNKNVKRRILEHSLILRDEEVFLDRLAEAAYRDCVVAGQGRDGVWLKTSAVLALAPALQRRSIRLAVREVRGGLSALSFRHVDRVLELFRLNFKSNREGKELHLPGSLVVRREGGTAGFEIVKNPKRGRRILRGESKIAVAEERRLAVPGATDLPEVGVRLRSRVIDKRRTSCDTGSLDEARLDFDQIGEGVKVRFYREGDCFAPLGMVGRKSLKKFFIDAKIPRTLRSRTPLLTTADGRIIWVYGCRIAHPFRVTENTRRVLVVKGESQG
jgi:tRNA(Ile)-lysidine synthase